MNRTLKETLAKLCQETGLPLTDLLPVALLQIRNTPNQAGYTPYELVYGRPTPIVRITGPTNLPVKEEIGQRRYLEHLGKVLDQIGEAQLGFEPKPRGGRTHTIQGSMCG